MIHLDRQSPPSSFDVYRPKVVPFYNYLQAAFVLAEDGRLGGNGVLDVARVLMLRYGFDPEALGRSYLDLLRRGHARGNIGSVLRAGLSNGGDDLTVRARLEEMLGLIDRHLAMAGPRVSRGRPVTPRDYVELAARHRGGRNRKRFHALRI